MARVDVDGDAQLSYRHHQSPADALFAAAGAAKRDTARLEGLGILVSWEECTGGPRPSTNRPAALAPRQAMARQASLLSFTMVAVTKLTVAPSVRH